MENKSDDEEDDDDDEDDDGNEDDAKQPTDSKLPADIKGLLNGNKLKYKETVWKAGSGDRGYRALGDAVQNLGNDIGDKNYPRFHRFVSIVDLRDGDAAEPKDPKMFVFGPQDGAEKIHKNPTALNFFHNSKASIIPNDKFTELQNLK